MNKHERVRAAFRRQPVDRVPIALWRHFPNEDQSADGLARAVVSFQRRFDFDLIKVTPTADYLVLEWGVTSAYTGRPEGARDVTGRPITGIGDWAKIRAQDVSRGSPGQQLEAIRLVVTQIAGDAPILQTIFSPLSTFAKIGGERWLSDLRSDTDEVKAALEAIAGATATFARESLRAGADGIFFATQAASRKVMGEDEYRRFGQALDQRILEAVSDSDFNVLHLHGKDVFFDLAREYPIAAVNWHDRRTIPSLVEAISLTTRGLIGGIDEVSTLQVGSPDEVKAQVRDAISQTRGLGLIIGAGCVMRVDAPEANVRAAIDAARQDHS